MKNYLNEETVHEKTLLVFTFIAVYLVYLTTMPKHLVLEDDGLFLMTSYFAGVPHPSGYPLYSMLGKMVASVPLFTLPVKIHAMTAFFGAATCMTIALIAKKLTGSLLVALIAAATLAFSDLFWSQSVIADVYTLNSFLLSLFLLLSVSLILNMSVSDNVIPNNRRIKKSLLYVFFIYGLSLSAHFSISLLCLPVLLIVSWVFKDQVKSNLLVLFISILLGLLPYLWMLWRSNTEVFINFYGPIESLSEFLFYVFRKGYIDIDVSQSAGLVDKLYFLKYLLHQTSSQFFLPAYFFIVVGFIYQWGRWPRSICLSLLYLYLSNSVLFLFLIYFDYDLVHQSVFKVYPMLSYCILIVWMSLGVLAIMEVLNRRLKIGHKNILILAIGSIVVLGTAHQNVYSNNRHEYDWAVKYTENLIGALPKNSILFVRGDIPVFTLGYMRYVENIRPDIEIYELNGLVFSNRLFDPLSTSDIQQQRILQNFISKSKRPVCSTDRVASNQSQTDHWLFACFNNTQEIIYKVSMSNEMLNYYEEILNSKLLHDGWTVHHRQRLFYRMGFLLGKLSYFKNDENYYMLDNYRNKTIESFHGALGYLEGKMSYPQAHDVKNLNDMISVIRSKTTVPLLASKRDKATLYNIRGYVSEVSGNRDNAINEYKNSYSIWPVNDNLAQEKLKQLR